MCPQRPRTVVIYQAPAHLFSVKFVWSEIYNQCLYTIVPNKHDKTGLLSQCTTCPHAVSCVPVAAFDPDLKHLADIKGIFGHDSATVRLQWARDNQGLDDFL